jgi:hypothetical protein
VIHQSGDHWRYKELSSLKLLDKKLDFRSDLAGWGSTIS